MSEIAVVVPDLGDVKDVAVAEVLVKPGDLVELEQPLVVVESDKATIDIPSNVAAGDRIAAGAALAMIAAGEIAAPVSPVPTVETGRSSPQEASVDLVVIGGGPGGYSAAFRAADLGLKVALVERGETLGGVCLNVGCIPSKALLHVAAAKEEAERLAMHGIRFSPPELDLDGLRGFRHATVSRLTGGLAQMAKQRNVRRLTGEARLAGPDTVAVVRKDGGVETLAFKSCVIATGSSPVRLPVLPDDPRVVDSTGALDLPLVPRRMLVVGGGIIGLEMATVYSALGARIDIVEMADRLLGGVDADLVSVWMKRNAHRFDRIMLSTGIAEATAGADGIHVRFGGDVEPATYDLVLQAVGRRPNSGGLALERAGLAATDAGFLAVDAKMRTSVPNIFAIGDVVGQPMLAHKAVHQGHVAAEVAAGHKAAFEPMVIPSVAYADPEIAWVGLTEDAAKSRDVEVRVARFPWAASGRAIANGADYGMTKLLFAGDNGRIVGGAIVGPNAGDMIGEICLAIELGADAVDIGRTIHPHPTLGETIGMAAEAALGACTDLPPAPAASGCGRAPAG